MKNKKRPTKKELGEAGIYYDPYTKTELAYLVIILFLALVLIFTGFCIIQYS